MLWIVAARREVKLEVPGLPPGGLRTKEALGLV
jgi:hypothetical protein